MSWIADQLVAGVGQWRLVDSGRAAPREARFLKLDASKSRASLAWRPFLPLDQALEWIVEWYRAFHSGADANLLTRTQIERYEDLLKK